MSMTLRTAGTGLAPRRPLPGGPRGAGPGSDGGRPVTARGRVSLPPGWPLSALLIGYPLWWVLGLTEPASLAAAVVMAVELVARRRVRAPRGFGLWLVFLVWVALGALVVQVDATGAVAGDSPTRYLTGAFRLSWYLRATVVLLYVVNLRRELTTTWVTRTLGWMFVTITVGGVLGVLVPTLTMPSLLELVLPRGVSGIPFVRSLIHPVFSELQNNLGGALRPSAPFTYANEWGFNFACFLPFFLHAWCGRDGGWRRPAAPLVLLAALVPVIFSLNRGLWLALLAAGLFVALRSALAGRFRMLAALVAGVVLAGTLVAATPLGGTIETRLENGNSDAGRTQLAVLGLTTMATTSPVVGLGTTRQVQGGFASIAQGSTPTCPRCGPPSMGTQGQLWLVAFCQGIGGVLLYFGFLLLQLLRGLRAPTSAATVGLSVVVVALVTSPVYGADNLGLVAVMAGIGLLTREGARGHGRARSGGPEAALGPSVGAYAEVVRRHVAVIAAAMVAGAAVGVLVQGQEGMRAVATESVLVPEEPTYLTDGSVVRTLDTEAQLAAQAAAEHQAAAAADGKLTITAVPNSRILTLTSSTTAGPAAARAVVDTAAAAALRARSADLEARRESVLTSLRTRSAALADAVATIDRSRAEAGPESAALAERRYRLLVEAGDVASQVSRATSLPLEVGQTLGPAEVRETRDDWLVAVATGLGLGLVAGLLLALGREDRSSRLARRGRSVAADRGWRLRRAS